MSHKSHGTKATERHSKASSKKSDQKSLDKLPVSKQEIAESSGGFKHLEKVSHKQETTISHHENSKHVNIELKHVHDAIREHIIYPGGKISRFGSKKN